MFAYTGKCGQRSRCTHTMRAHTCVSVVVCVACKLRPCPSYSGRRDRNNSVHWRSLYKGKAYTNIVNIFHLWVCSQHRGADSAGSRTPTPPPPPQGASSQQLVAKGAALRSQWAPKAPDAPWAPKAPEAKFCPFCTLSLNPTLTLTPADRRRASPLLPCHQRTRALCLGVLSLVHDTFELNSCTELFH